VIDPARRGGARHEGAGPPCSRIVGLLVDYLEDRLSARTRADLEQHLTACPRCEAQINTYRSTVALLRSISEHDLPPELRTTLTAFLTTRDRN
jgi:hypothetical protein